MTNRVRLHSSLSRSRFWCGEPIPLAITIENLDDAQPLAVPVPFAPSRSEIRFLLQGTADTAPIALGPVTPSDGPSVQLPPADFYMTEASLTEWHTFDPGAYTLEVRWTHAAGETLAEPVRFEVVAPDAMALAILAGSFPEAPPSLLAVATVSGPGLGVLLERRFCVDIEDDTSYPHAGDATRFVAGHPLAEPIPVFAAAEPNAWVAWSTERGLFARPGHEVEGAAEARWPDESPASVIAPAVETRQGELLVYTLRGDGDCRELVETRFTLPVVEVEEAEGPDDWDDEVLVPGPVNETTIGEIEIGEATTTLTRAAEDDVRVLALSPAGDGSTLHHVQVRGGIVKAFATPKLPGVPLPHAEPAAFVDHAGETVAAVTLVRTATEPLDALTLGVMLARFGASGPSALEEVWLGNLPAAPTSAVVAFSCIETERPFFRCVVLCEDGSVCVGDRTGRWEAHTPAAELLLPLVLTTCIDHAHVGVRGPNGPTLERLFPLNSS